MFIIPFFTFSVNSDKKSSPFHTFLFLIANAAAGLKHFLGFFSRKTGDNAQSLFEKLAEKHTFFTKASNIFRNTQQISPQNSGYPAVECRNFAIPSIRRLPGA